MQGHVYRLQLRQCRLPLKMRGNFCKGEAHADKYLVLWLADGSRWTEQKVPASLPIGRGYSS